MSKFKLSALLGRNSATATDSEKKQHRRSLAVFSSKPAKGTEPTPAKRASESDESSVTEQPGSRMAFLAEKIAKETAKIEAYMKENKLPMPSFDVDAPADFPQLPPDILKSRHEVLFASRELALLAQGPRESIRWGVWQFLDVLALQVINHFDIAKLVPVDSTISLAELQEKTSLDPINLARIVRLAMTNGIFKEPSPGVIAHTAASRVLAEDGDLQGWIGFNSEDIFPASAHVLQALKTHPEGISLTRTGFNFAFDTVDKEPMFATFGKDPNRARRMGRAMASLTGGEGYEVSYFVDTERGGYDLSEIDAKGGTFVDIGGSHGFVCVDLAKKYKNMKFVVQDLPKTVDSAPKPICDDTQIAERISLLPHDFFTEQVTKDADVYYFRWIIHNYSTPYAVKILKNLIPALKPGARIIINDHCLREPGQESPWDERVMRGMDVVMLTLLNAQERTEKEFRGLFEAASDGFVFKGVTRPPGCRMSIIEAVWRPDLITEEEAVVEESAGLNVGAVESGKADEAAATKAQEDAGIEPSTNAAETPEEPK